MKIGFVNFYSFRPHVEHSVYLAHLCELGGHETVFLTCDAHLPLCYPRALKQTNKLTECSKCILGGFRSYDVGPISSLSEGPKQLCAEDLDALALSSACTLNRTESEDDWSSDAVQKTIRELRAPVDKAFSAVSRWIEEQGIDAVICFNGRMDVTRAATYACERLGIPYITHERTWFGDGLNLNPNANCLSLRAVNEMVANFDDKPLTKDQSLHAGKLAGERFLQRNSLEWRLYNQNPEPAPWPVQTRGLRVLVVPSSKNEFAGHADWESGWSDNTHALDDLFEAFSINPSQVVVRCHPNWAENIGKATGERSLNHYVNWARLRGVHCIHSEDKANTYELIQQADVVVMNGGSSAVEAGVCGKQVICLGPSTYQSAGFVRTFHNRSELLQDGALDPLAPDVVRRKTLRFLYLRSRRLPQYVDYVRALDTTTYRYFSGGDPDRLEMMFRKGVVLPDDERYADDTAYEDEVIRMLVAHDWGSLADYVEDRPHLEPLGIGRRQGFGWVDKVRGRMSRGDRG
ncbi:hypothetical protein LV475_06860 [Guyparkeria hydrothermalis]|uniref:hypothetical protein n=1 Tax=Guyparkeria hydrothermalis TaxID=923 RepID=UPI0020205B98|nr:hypothetical protein [Guyparkeria hydrothermalis]MCL7751315.1 hypothetical protein [Guyparkeria hydrothermalis]